jgi:hypothetical protein
MGANFDSHFERGTETEFLRRARIFGPKREEDGPWRELHNDELHSLYSALKLLGD